MPRFLIDVNLPYRFSVWKGPRFQHVFDLGDTWKDRQIWEYAKAGDMVIVSKDADFSDRIMLSKPPPRVVQICLGNMKMREFHRIVERDWPWIERNIGSFRLIRVFQNHMECIGDDEERA